MFSGMVKSPSDVAAVIEVEEGCGEHYLAHGCEGTAGKCDFYEAGTYLSCGGMAVGAYMASPPGIDEEALSMYCVMSC